MEHALRKNEVIAQLVRSEHGNLGEYAPVVKLTAMEDPEFLAHIIAWDLLKGQIRDTKIALPVASLAVPSFDGELRENSLAHLLLLSPRDLARAVRFTRDPAVALGSTQRKRLSLVVEQYLRAREEKPRFFESAAMQHRESMKELYALNHIKPGDFANRVLFKGQKVGVFKDIAELKNMSAQEAASVILKRKIPFLVLQGAMGSRLKEPDVVLAMIGQMSATELVTNTKMLERLGIKTNPALRAAYEAGLQKVATSKKATLKTTRAAEQIGDKQLSEKLRGAQEKQLKALGGVDGDWLVLGDKSGSMSAAIDGANQVAAILAKMVKGKVHLVFFDSTPRYFDVTGKNYDEIKSITGRVTANGYTSIGCGLQYMLDKKLRMDGIAIISDMGENTHPHFAAVYQKVAKAFDSEPTVYLYIVGAHFPPGQNPVSMSMNRIGVDVQEFDLNKGFDYYSLPTLVQTMRVQRYSLVDEIMETPLLTREQVLKGEKDGNVREAA